MSWNKIEDHLFDEYCVEGEDKVLEQLMKEHDEELKKEFASELKKLFTDFLHIEDIGYYKEDVDKIIEQAQENTYNKKTNNKYKLLENFDAYICNVGRIQVNAGAEFEIQKSPDDGDKIYFLNSKNYLPYEAVSLFLERKREPLDKTLKNTYQDIHIKMNEEKYCIFTSEQNDGYNSNHEYQFSSKEEFLKFVDGEKAIDRYGQEIKRGYYEHIEQAYTKGEIDIFDIYEKLNEDVENDYDK